MSEEKRIPARSEVNEKDTWDLTDLYPSDEAWEKDAKRVDEFVEKFSAFKGTLGTSGDKLLAFFQLRDESEDWIKELSNYAHRKNDQDTKEPKYQAYAGQMTSIYVKLDECMAYVNPEILAISEATLEKFFKETEGLELYRRAIGEITRRKEHILSEEMESLLASAYDVCAQPSNIYEKLTDADISFEDATDSEGKKHQVTHGSYGLLLESDDRTLRKSAFESTYGFFKQYSNTLASTLEAQFKQLNFNAKARHYENTLEAALDVTNVPVSVYLNLIDACHKNMDKMYDYVALRKKALGVDELHFYDLYASITGESGKRIAYEDAVKEVLEAVKPLGEDYCKVLEHGLTHRWVDVYENIGKRSGAYSAGTKTHPYVLLNYNETLDSEFTLAHEMGHAMHSYHSYKGQPTVYSEYEIFVAEVASTCNECLLMQYLLDKTTDKKERAALINHFLEQFKGTFYRQTMFAEFELNMNRLSEAGEVLTAELICAEYEKLQRLYFGDAIVIDEGIKYEWARIPHFYYNYYVFQYATSFAASVALSQKILKEGKPAVDKYLEFLSGGCSKDPVELLKGAGVDLTTTEPITQALEVFEGLIKEMEELLK